MESKLKMIVTVGIPASGKSTFASEHKEYNSASYFYTDRDDIRERHYNEGKEWSKQLENEVSKEQKGDIVNALMSGKNVVVSDTNVNPKARKALESIADQFGAEFTLKHFPIDLETALERNSKREGWKRVKDDIIQQMYVSYVEQFPIQYVPDTSLPEVYVFDIDGTLARKGDRGYYDWKKVGVDTPIPHVIKVAESLVHSYQTIFLSGRDEVCYNETMDWIINNVYIGIGAPILYMRPEGSHIRDTVVKHDLFYKHLANKYNVLAVFDDRPSVCRMWRKMGVNVFNVGDPYQEF